MIRQLTRRDGLERVLEGIAAARRAGFDPVKVNAVSIRGITEHLDREGHSVLGREDATNAPARGQAMEEVAASPSGHIVDRACNESLRNVHSAEALFRSKVGAVLRDRRLHHGRTKVRRIRQALRPGVIRFEV